ncbi:MAG: hypothetical protein EA359_15385 [Balneolaceae bacterium]|nr:MAG: hypothetical protein EA359_15385 [Balneolaceae bacterium]
MPLHAASASESIPVTLQLDFAGAKAMIRVLEQDSLSEAAIDELLHIHGVRAMVDNVTRFIPRLGIPEFRSEIHHFTQKKRAGDHEEFQLSHVWRERTRVRDLVNAIQADESGILRETLSLLEPYRPNTGPLSIQVYFVAGGVSDGFVFNDDRSFYINLVRAGGDCHEVIANVVHEAYHVMQVAAQKQSGTYTDWGADDVMPYAERVLAGTLIEGTATYVADPARLTAPAGSLRTARKRYLRSADPVRIAENFAVFDAVMQGLREGTMTWPEASEKGFTRSPVNEDRFYFVGYEMAKAIERHCGTTCIPRFFEQPPVEFFRQYITLYREHPEIQWHFAPETEKYIMELM